MKNCPKKRLQEIGIEVGDKEATADTTRLRESRIA
jgi:hypothetical protein